MNNVAIPRPSVIRPTVSPPLNRQTVSPPLNRLSPPLNRLPPTINIPPLNRPTVPSPVRPINIIFTPLRNRPTVSPPVQRPMDPEDINIMLNPLIDRSQNQPYRNRTWVEEMEDERQSRNIDPPTLPENRYISNVNDRMKSIRQGTISSPAVPQADWVSEMESNRRRLFEGGRTEDVTVSNPKNLTLFPVRNRAPVRYRDNIGFHSPRSPM